MSDKLPEKEINKFFDSKNYNTILVNTSGHTKKENETSELIISLIDGKLTPEERNENLALIKEQNNREILLSSIATIQNPEKKSILIAACWEVGFDFSDEFLLFVDLACDDNYHVALEAFTVIETIESNIIPEDLENAKEKVSKKITQNPPTLPLLIELLNFINTRLS